MRTDEQIVFTAGNAPLRCGRAIWFRRDDMRSCVGTNRFYRGGAPANELQQTLEP
jgi:type IV secretion system protein VirD4